MTCNNVILGQPEANTSVSYTIPEGDSARLNFTPDQISGLQLGDNGELIVSFSDGGQLTVTNFAELADGGNLVYLQDGTLVDPSILTAAPQAPAAFMNVASIADSPVDSLVVAQPGPNTTQEFSMEEGMKYVCDFNPANAASVEIIDGKMVLTFADGSQVIMNNFQTAMAGELPPELTIADGTVIEPEALLTEVTEVIDPIEEILEFAQSDSAEEVANVEPAAGEEDLAAVAEELADIETAAGEDGSGSASNTGFGFGSSATGAPLLGPDAIGPLGPTQLNYQAPSLTPDRIFLSNPNSIPTISFGENAIDETNLDNGNIEVTGSVTATYGDDGPGAITTTCLLYTSPSPRDRG